MTDDWYSDPELVRLREDMLRAHRAWKQAARRPTTTDELSQQQRDMMEAARTAVDRYMTQRDICRRGRAAPHTEGAAEPHARCH